MASSQLPKKCFGMVSPLLFLLLLLIFGAEVAQGGVCRKSCGGIPIEYPLGVDEGCGSPRYRRIISCTAAGELLLLTPSGRYPIKKVSYSGGDAHIVLTDPLMWNCQDGDRFRRPTRPFSLDSSTPFALSPHNDYLFFNCSARAVLTVPSRPHFCDRFPEECDSACDSGSFLCRNLPECPSALRRASCCAYSPQAAESLRMMLRHCASYTGVYWRNLSAEDAAAFGQVPEYGVRVDFQIPVTAECVQCAQAGGGATCGFDTHTQAFRCLCSHRGNTTTTCNDIQHKKVSKAVAGASIAVSVSGAVGIGAGVWYLRRVRAKAPITHGVQTNDNRLF